MGTISISIPLKVNGSFRIKDPKLAKKLVQELEKMGERTSPFDDVLGICAGRTETDKELTEKLRKQSNRRDG